jgi:hypothetical protein
MILAPTAQTAAPQTTAAELAAGARWPTGVPSWMEGDLAELASEGALFGVPPQAIASVAKGESGYEAAGAGVNPEGYGGYLGLAATQPVSTPKGTATVSASLLETSSQPSFVEQAQVAAGRIATLAQGTGGTVVRAIQAYGNGPNTLATGRSGATVPTIDSEIYVNTVLGGANAQLTGFLTWAGEASGLGAVAGGVTGQPSGGVPGKAAHSVTHALTEALGGVFGGWKSFAAEAMLIVGGLALVVVGIAKAAGAHPAKDATSALGALA